MCRWNWLLVVCLSSFGLIWCCLIVLKIWWFCVFGIGIVLCSMLLMFSVNLVICWLVVKGNFSCFFRMWVLGLKNFILIWVLFSLVIMWLFSIMLCSCIGILVLVICSICILVGVLVMMIDGCGGGNWCVFIVLICMISFSMLSMLIL